MIVREASTADVQSIAEVHVAGWRETYAGILPCPLSTGLRVEQRGAIWSAVHGDAEVTLLVGEDEMGAIMGFGAAGLPKDPLPPFEVEVYALYVVKEAQRRGLGRALLGRLAGAQLELGRRSALLWVFRDNLAARRFYERLGGELVDEQPKAFGEITCVEVAYGWRDLAPLTGVVDQGGRP